MGRVLPVTARIRFQTPAQFEEGARQAVEHWLGQLAATRFHVRMHRRGFKGRLSSQDEERFLDQYITAGRGADTPAVSTSKTPTT